MRSVKNVTIVLDEDVARWLRVRAAENETSVSRYVGDLLGGVMEQELRYDSAREEFFSVSPRRLRETGSPLPTREALYDRDLR